jgi:hypothetical protein
MLSVPLDWRSSPLLGAIAPFLPLADDVTRRRPPARYVLTFTCRRCGTGFMASAPLALPQHCPDCGGVLERRGDAWDLVKEARPPRWRDPLDLWEVV